MASGNISTHISEQEIVGGLLSIGIERKRAEEQLFRQYDYFMKEGIRKYSLSNDESFDAYSDAVISAIDKITNRSFEGRSSLKTWIYQIFHNKCVDLLRKKTTNKNSIHKTLSVSDVLYQLSDASKTIIQQLVERADGDLLKMKLNELGAGTGEIASPQPVETALRLFQVPELKPRLLEPVDQVTLNFKQ